MEGGRPLSDKYINNILVVLSKALKYAEDVELIARVPRVGIFRTERPEIVCWDVEQYARLLASAIEARITLADVARATACVVTNAVLVAHAVAAVDGVAQFDSGALARDLREAVDRMEPRLRIIEREVARR